MRQKEDAKFAAMLNRIRVHPCGVPLKAEDAEMLKSVAYDIVPSDKQNVLHIFPTNKEVTAHNNVMVQTVCNPCCSSVAKDFTKSRVTGQVKQRDSPYSYSSQEDLLDVLKIGIGARIMLTRNIDTADGLVNGAFGTVTGLEQSQSQKTEGTAVYVKFDNPHSGKTHRSKLSSKISGSKDAVKICPIEEQLMYRDVIRKQLPLKLGWASTIHKVQGMTAKDIVISLKAIFQPGMAYVALSRVTSLQGMHILHMNTKAFYASEEITQALENMQEFLQDELSVSKENCFTVVLHNTEGLLPHREDILISKIFENANIICFTETWLNKNVTIPASFLPNFDVHSRKREEAYSCTDPLFKQLASLSRGGVAIFLQKSVRHIRSRLHVRDLECFAVTVEHPMKATIITIYRPPHYPVKVFANNLKHFLGLVDKEVKTPVLIAGDFNENALSNNTQLLGIIKQYGYKQLVDKQTTEAGTCLDLVFVKGFSVNPSIVIQPIYYSFHDPVIVSLSV